MAGSRSIRDVEGPRVPRPLCGPRRARVLPRLRVDDVPPDQLAAPGPSGVRHDARRRERGGRRGARAEFQRRSRARSPARPEGVAGLLPHGRRRTGRRPDVGGRPHVREVQPRQPHGDHRSERDPAGRADRRDPPARAARGQVEVLWLERADDQRSRHATDPPRDRRGARAQGPAHGHHREDDEGEGRVVHGERREVPRRGDERRGTAARARGARRGAPLTSVAPIPWKMESQRSYFAKALIELGEKNPNVVVVGGDTTESIKTMDFGKKFPDRLFNVGITEQNMIAIAAGLAAAGKVAFASTYAVFGVAHTYNVIRQNVT